MRLIKRQTTNSRSITGKGVQYDIDDQVILDSKNVMLIPKGTTADRPQFPNEGHLRFNTSTDTDGAVVGFESYYDSSWRRIRFKEPNQNPGIVQQNLGVGDATETVFRPLDSGDPDYPVPAAAQNVIVLVENVFQLATTNYTLEQSVGGNLTGPNAPYADGWYLKFSSPVPLGKEVTVLHNFDK